MMRLGPAGRHELLPHPDWQREIGKPIPVKMAQFAAADTEFHSAEPVRRHRHTCPTGNGLLNQFAEGFNHHYTV
jgi:hypothetical protein